MTVAIAMRCAARCNVCGGRDFVAAEYTSDAGRAPAIECSDCRALNLHEDAASTEAERDSVKLAIAIRRALSQSPDVSQDELT